MRNKRAAVFVSGNGSNMENLVRQAQAGKLGCDIALVVCDNSHALALKRAGQLKAEAWVIDRKQFPDRAAFDAAISAKLKEKKIDAIFLAGFMRILGPEFVRDWRGRILNIHPSMLPKYPGTHAIRDAFEAGEKETGVTVHLVDEGVDTGPVLLQRKVSVQPGDTLEALERRVHAAEYELYPEAVRVFLRSI